jgi:signal peptidase II
MKKTLLLISLIILDQISKFWAMYYLASPLFIFSFFKLNFVQNKGIAFSLPVAQYIVIPLTILAIIWLFYQIYKNNSSPKIHTNYKFILNLYAYIFILSGAIGNLIDRLIYSKVTDFLSFWSFPTFNLADSFISIGIVFFIGSEFLKTEKK